MNALAELKSSFGAPYKISELTHTTLVYNACGSSYHLPPGVSAVVAAIHIDAGQAAACGRRWLRFCLAGRVVLEAPLSLLSEARLLRPSWFLAFLLQHRLLRRLGAWLATRRESVGFPYLIVSQTIPPEVPFYFEVRTGPSRWWWSGDESEVDTDAGTATDVTLECAVRRPVA